MEKNEINFENLPKAVALLVNEVAELKTLVTQKQETKTTNKRIPIEIEEASKIIGKAKPTIYALVRKRLLPCYKNGKKLYFFEDELLKWIESGKKKTIKEIHAESNAFVSRKKTQQRF